jgi:hypothetical protein
LCSQFWISGGLRRIFRHSGQCLYQMPSGAKSDFRPTFRNLTTGVNLGVSVLYWGEFLVADFHGSVLRVTLYRGLTARMCIYVQSTLTVVRQVERRMTKLLCCQTRRMLTL